MYTVVVVVNLISRVERIRRMEAVERERALQRERIELSHAIHNTMAQSAYLIGVGIERAKELADRSNEDLMSTLDETEALSRSAMWEMRHPMEIGEIFEGMELGGVLESLAATFSTISSIPADLVQTGVEPPLPIATRGALFSIAFNALTNALRHSHASHVRVGLDFESGTACGCRLPTTGPVCPTTTRRAVRASGTCGRTPSAWEAGSSWRRPGPNGERR